MESDTNIVVEVISPSNSPQELTEKLFDYQTLASIEVIVYLDPDKRVLTVDRRRGTGWTERQSATGTVTLGEGRAEHRVSLRRGRCHRGGRLTSSPRWPPDLTHGLGRIG